MHRFPITASFVTAKCPNTDVIWILGVTHTLWNVYTMRHVAVKEKEADLCEVTWSDFTQAWICERCYSHKSLAQRNTGNKAESWGCLCRAQVEWWMAGKEGQGALSLLESCWCSTSSKNTSMDWRSAQRRSPFISLDPRQKVQTASDSSSRGSMPSSGPHKHMHTHGMQTRVHILK